MEFFRKEYWSGMPFTSPGDLKPACLASPALAGGLFTTAPPGKPSQGGKPVQSQADLFPILQDHCFSPPSVESLDYDYSLYANNYRKLTKLITWTTALSNSMKLWAMPCRAIQDRWVTMDSSDKMWSTGEGNGKPLKHSCLENPMNSMKRQKDRTLKDECPRSVDAQLCYWRREEK